MNGAFRVFLAHNNKQKKTIPPKPEQQEGLFRNTAVVVATALERIKKVTLLLLLQVVEHVVPHLLDPVAAVWWAEQEVTAMTAFP